MNINLDNTVFKLTKNKSFIFKSYKESKFKFNDDLFINDPTKEIEEDKLNSLCENILNDDINSESLTTIIRIDVLLSMLLLKINKKVSIIKKLFEDQWTGIEAVKQVEKLEFGLLALVKNF